MTVTMTDVEIVSTEEVFPGHTRKIVKHNDRVFSLLVQNVDLDNQDQMVSIMEKDFLLALALMGQVLAPVETWVVEEVWSDQHNDFMPKYECDDSCDGTQCNKAVAKKVGVADMALAEGMLIDFLNA